eukprot:gene12184-13321_t
MTPYYYCCLMTLFFLSLVNSTPTSFTSSDCNDPLACYLSSLTFNIPDVTSGDFSLTGTVCKGIDLYSLPSRYDGYTGFYFGIQDLGTSCSGSYKYGKAFKGTVTIAVSKTDVAMTVNDRKENELPVYMELTSCNLENIQIDITFSQAGLDFLTPLIESAIQKALYKIFCDGINHLLTVNVTNFLVNKLDPRLEEIIVSLPDPLPQYGKHYLNWNDSIISKAHGIVEKIRGAASLPDFLQCMANSGKYSNTNKPRAAASLSTSLVQYDEAPYEKFFKNLLGTYSFDLSSWDKSEVLKTSQFSLKVSKVDISGLDTITDVQIVEPIPESKVSLRTALKMGYLKLDLTFELTVNGNDANGNPHTYNEQTVVSLTLTDPGLVLDLAIAVDEHLLDSYYLDQLSSIGCWLSPIAEISIPNFEIDLTGATVNIKEITGDAGLLEADITALLNNLFLLVLEPTGFGTLSVETIKGAFQGPIRQGLNEFFAKTLSEGKAQNPCLAHYPYDDVTEYISWPNSNVIAILDSIINDMFGYQGLNKLFSCGTGGTGAFEIDTKRLIITVSGLTSFYGLEVFSPYDQDSKQYHLSTYLAAGYCPSTDNCTPLTIGVNSITKEAIAEFLGTSPTASITTAVSSMVEGVSLLLTFENFRLGIETLTKLNINALKQLQHYQMGTTGCYASSLDQLAFQYVDLNVSKASFIYHDGTNNKEITQAINSLLAFITKNETIQNKNVDIDSSLTNAPAVCANAGVVPDDNDGTTTSDGGSDTTLDWEWQLFILICGCILSLSALLMAYSYWGRDRKLACLAMALKDEHDQPVLHDDGKTIWERWDFGNALVFREEVPTWLKVGMPIAICTAIGIFAWSNATPNAVDVMVKLHIGEKIVDVGSIFEFGLGNTVHDMWSAEVYALAIIIAFFSGAWPYMKLMAMLFAWFVPPKVLTVEKRETLLIVLDALGKWSLVDFFVMVLMLCAFYIQLWVGSNILVDVTVKPELGFYTFLIATMMSLGLSHLILACHRLIVEPKVLPIPDELDPRESLAAMTYEVKVSLPKKEILALTNTENSEEIAPLSDAGSTDSEEQEKVLCIKFTYFGKIFVGAMILATTVLIVFGCFYYTMGFEFKGLVGLMLKDKAKVDYSYVSIGNSIPEHSGIPDDFGVRWMQASFFLFGLAMPLALMTVFMVMWTVPLTLGRQRQLFVLSEVLNAWSTLDVFCCAIAAGLLEIQQFAMFIVGDSCDKINEILAQYLDEPLQGDDKCFDVVAYLKEDSWLIFLAAAMILLVGIPFLRIAHHAIKQRLETTTTTVIETVRRRSRSIGLYNGSLKEKEEVMIIEEGPISEKTLVEPLVEKNVDGTSDRPSEGANSNNNTAIVKQEEKKKSFWSFLSFPHTQYYMVKGCAKIGLITMYFKETSRPQSSSAFPNTNIGGSNSGSGNGSFSGAFSPVSRNSMLDTRQD